MKIGIISDIHGYPKRFTKALKYFNGCEMILCAGDILYHGPRNPILEGYNPQELIEEFSRNKIPILIAKGNCDAEVDQMVLNLPIISEYIVYEKDAVRFIINHGHSLDENKLKDMAEAYNVNVFVTGHTHIRKYEKYSKTMFVNPGSVSIPRGDMVPSIAIYEDGLITFINIETGEIITGY